MYENKFEDVICKITAILSQPCYVNHGDDILTSQSVEALKIICWSSWTVPLAIMLSSTLLALFGGKFSGE